MDNFTGFFLAANTKDGFFSLFDKAALERRDRRVFAVKGGPGSGKSTLIRALCEKSGGKIQLIRCLADPLSLDGAIFEERGVVILDGTAPHALEPELPGAAGGYITMPGFKDAQGLREKLPALRGLAESAGEHYAQSTRFICAAARLEEGVRARLEPHISERKLRMRAGGIAGREFGKKRAGGRVFERFIDGITPQGAVRLCGALCQMKVYLLSDSYRLAGPMLDELRLRAVECGHEVLACLCPLDGRRVLHLIIPALGLAFVTADAWLGYSGPVFRNIRIDAYISSGPLREQRGKIRLTHKIFHSLLDDAVAELRAARQQHEEIELLYRPHIDIEAHGKMLESLEKLLETGG